MYLLERTHKFDDYFECLNNWLGEKFICWSITIFKFYPFSNVSNDSSWIPFFLVSLTPPVFCIFFRWGLFTLPSFQGWRQKSIYFNITSPPHANIKFRSKEHEDSWGMTNFLLPFKKKKLHIFSFSRFNIQAVSVKSEKEEDRNGKNLKFFWI